MCCLFIWWVLGQMYRTQAGSRGHGVGTKTCENPCSSRFPRQEGAGTTVVQQVSRTQEGQPVVLALMTLMPQQM